VNQAGTERRDDRWNVAGICIFLAAVVWVVFGQTLHHQFVNFDDDKYVTDNPIVQKGLTWEGFRWAFTYGSIGHWHPLTWLSQMLDCQLYGLNPAGHHLTNVLLHTASAILLFLVLRQMTGFLWRSAFVAALFAIHPLRAESVGWISERKDVLSAFFFMLTLGAYVRYAQRPPSLARYPAVVLCLTLGLLSKNMLVTTPFVLLLLDYWPLHRLSSPADLRKRLIEKIPLFVLVLGSCVATALVPEKVESIYQLPFLLRVENALTSYVIYLGQTFYPTDLACLYPEPTHLLPFWQVLGSLGLLLAISIAAYALRKTQPPFIVGWFWFLGMLVPAIGIAQISYYAHADRYTYLPQIGICLALTWMLLEWCRRWRLPGVVPGGLAALALAALIILARKQTACWQDSLTLWTHTLACTSDNSIAHNDLGNALLEKGDVDAAITQYQTALRIQPANAPAEENLGNALLQNGDADNAIVHLNHALQLQPHVASTHYNLANALLKKGLLDEAIAHYESSLQIDPLHPETCLNLGNALLEKDDAKAAISSYQRALEIKPNYPVVENKLAWIFATAPEAALRNGARAVELAQQADQSAHDGNPVFLHTLAAAYAEAGRFSDAQNTAAKALTIANTHGPPGLADQIARELKLYTAGLPYHHDSQ